MVEILRNKNVATRFQILVEIAAMQPTIQQKDIARRLDVIGNAIFLGLFGKKTIGILERFRRKFQRRTLKPSLQAGSDGYALDS